MSVSRCARASALAFTLAVAVAGCSGSDGDASAATTTPRVNVGSENITVVTQSLIESGPAISGSLAPEREATMRAEISGAVLQTYVEAGTRVNAGTPLARLDDTAIRDAFLSARSGVTSAQSNADLAARERTRAATLAAAGAIADRDLELATRNATAATSQLDDAKARLALAQKQLDDTHIRAPFAGVVSARSVSAGDVVAPGAALFTVVDPSSMRLEASVPAEQLASVRVGAPVSFTVNGYPGRVFTGRVTRVNPTADPVTRQVRIFASIPNAGSTLVGGLFADGRVTSESRTGAVVPLTAVDQRGLSPIAMRIRNGRVEKVEITLGLIDRATETVEIVSGVSTGDTLLLGAAQGITPGTPVRVSTPNDTPLAERP